MAAVGEIHVRLLVAGPSERFIGEVLHRRCRLRAHVRIVARRPGIPEPPSKAQIQNRQYDLDDRRGVIAHVRTYRGARDCGRSAERDAGLVCPAQDRYERRHLYARVLVRAPIAETKTPAMQRRDGETLRLALLPREPVRNRLDQVERY